MTIFLERCQYSSCVMMLLFQITNLIQKFQVRIGEWLTDVSLKNGSRYVHKSGYQHQQGTKHENENQRPVKKAIYFLSLELYKINSSL